jgi:hypothetical protein
MFYNLTGGQKVEYFDLTAEVERDIFQRVQLGMTLTAAGKSRINRASPLVVLNLFETEKLQAISSPWAE